MRGDLVFEKLGEIDPELVADALPNAMPLMSVSDLRKPPKPPRGTVWRRVMVIAACILLAGLLAVGGGVWLFREGAEQPWETDTVETSDLSDTAPDSAEQPPNGSGAEDTTLTDPSRIEGAFRVYDITGSQLLFVNKDPAHADAIEEIMAILNRATEPTKSMIESPGNFQMMIGDTTLIPNHGTLYNRTSGKTYAFSEGDWDVFYTLIREIMGYFPDGFPELAGYITYEHVTRHPRDAYSLSVTNHNPLYNLKSLTLVHESTDYSISMEEDFWGQSYICTIPEDAPFGKYTAYASFETLYDEEADAQEYMWKSVMTVAEHEKEPAYTFAYDWEKKEAVYHYGDTVSLYASLTNLGDDLYRYGLNTVLHPKAELRIRRGGETLSFKMTDGMVAEDGELIRSLPSGKQGERGWYTLLITEDMPVGMYDLVLSFEGHEQVFENAVAVMDPDKDCYYNMAFTITDTGDERTLKLYVTLHGKDIYRYGSSTCFAPDSLYLICEDGDATGVIVPELIAIDDHPIIEDGLYIRHWREGESMIFTYAFQIDLEDEINGTIPGVHDLVVNYKGEAPVRSEGALTVVAP